MSRSLWDCKPIFLPILEHTSRKCYDFGRMVCRIMTITIPRMIPYPFPKGVPMISTRAVKQYYGEVRRNRCRGRLISDDFTRSPIASNTVLISAATPAAPFSPLRCCVLKDLRFLPLLEDVSCSHVLISQQLAEVVGKSRRLKLQNPPLAQQGQKSRRPSTLMLRYRQDHSYAKVYESRRLFTRYRLQLFLFSLHSYVLRNSGVTTNAKPR